MGWLASIVLSSTVKWPNKRDSIGRTRTPRAKSSPQGSLFLPFPSIILPISFTLLSKLSPHTDCPGSLQSPVLALRDGWLWQIISSRPYLRAPGCSYHRNLTRGTRAVVRFPYSPPGFPSATWSSPSPPACSAQLGPCLSNRTAQWRAMPGPG